MTKRKKYPWMKPRPKKPERPPLTKERVDAFLKELAALSMKHLIYISGCGCCQSPYLVADEVGAKGEYVTTGSNFSFLNYKELPPKNNK